MMATPLRYVRHLSELGDWEMAIRPAMPALRPFVKNYTWYIDRAPQISRRMQVPHTGIVLIIGLGTQMHVVDPRVEASKERLLGTYVAGLFDAQVFTEYVGTSEGIQVDLTPLGAQRLLGVPMDSLTNRAIELPEILGARARRLEEQLLDTPGYEARLDLVETFILRRMAETTPAPAAIDWAWRQLHGSAGPVDIGALAEATGQSHKRLIASFREHIGVPPGMVSRLIRFERAVAAVNQAGPFATNQPRFDGAASSKMRSPKSVRLAEIAVDAGYYDQAHFNREFRSFAGVTPLEYAARLLPEGGGVSGMEAG